MTRICDAERMYRTWSSPILLELKERADQLDPTSRQALENVLIERRLLDTGNPSGKNRRKPGLSNNDEP
jgi:hypothetical protein